MTLTERLILVIGATGAQGRAVVDALLAPDGQGTESSYTVRALTRDPTSKNAQELTARGVECVKGSFTDYAVVAETLQGAYGAWVNTDSFAVGQMEEVYAGMRIYEVAKRVPSLRHYVWSNLRYVLKNASFNPEYFADHLNAKGRVGEWLSVQPSVLGDGFSWSQVTTGPYMEMLNGDMFAPRNVREDGTVVFAAPIEDGHVPMIALKDLGWWARYTFDHREETSGRELNVTSERVHWDHLVETFTKVTGKPAVFRRLTVDEWIALFDAEKLQVSFGNSKEKNANTLRDNMTTFWKLLRDDVIDKDMKWIRNVHPGTYTLERWMRENAYSETSKSVLKNTQTGDMSFGFKSEIAALL
ncbi:NAD(P)-binding protein [Mycena albidolilacea]|uniref:NAD(P)-binding protein n=1 Tax=Mycena albidolilacea TaxID=1033008 RepID=A0AAD7EAW3_9AGAR|nr:NAD(P)-binding protein [Mycena albidolilacea]